MHEPSRIILRNEREREASKNIDDPDERVMPTVLKPEDSERHADIAVETFVALTHMQMRRKHGEDRILGRRLADASSHCDDLRFGPH